MALDLTEKTITEATKQTFDDSETGRTKEVFTALVQHLHDFTREVRLTHEEWFTAIDFLERVGKITSPTRQEFVLLSDILGLSVLVDLINHHSGSSATESDLLGPFYVEGRPTAENGSDISGGVPGKPMFFTGTVVDTDGKPVAGAQVDTWHSDGEGFYDVQQTDKLHNKFAMRALFTTDENGRFWYRSINPRYYPVPTDGPCGEIMRAALADATGAHPLLVPHPGVSGAGHSAVSPGRPLSGLRRGVRRQAWSDHRRRRPRRG
jgi:hydroxyquinol 1,2-dioxygenase